MAAPPDVDIAVIYLFRHTRNEERMRQGSYVAGSGSGWVVECGICEGIAVNFWLPRFPSSTASFCAKAFTIFVKTKMPLFNHLDCSMESEE